MATGKKSRPASFGKALRLSGPFALLCMAALALPGCRESDRAPEKAAPSAPEATLDTLQGKVKPGEGFGAIVQSLGLDEAESDLLLSSLKDCFRFKLFAGQPYRVVFRSTAGGTAVESFALEDRGSESRHVLQRSENADAGFRIASLDYGLVPISVRTDTVLVNGTLSTSLYEAFMEKGETPALIQLVTRIFAWDVDFFKDPRVGDEFSLLVEKRYGEDGAFRGYGEVLSAKYVNGGHDFYGISYKGAYYDHQGRSLEKMLLRAPLNFARVSSGFGTRLHPILGIRKPHWGIDYAAPLNTKILSAGDGVVEYAKWVNGYGKTIKIRHNGVYSTYYAHLNGYASGMTAGRRVRQRDVIGFLGSTGMSTAPHLDYRVEKNGKYINPASLKSESKEGVGTGEWKEFCDHRDLLLTRMDAPQLQNFAKLDKGAKPRG